MPTTPRSPRRSPRPEPSDRAADDGIHQVFQPGQRAIMVAKHRTDRDGHELVAGKPCPMLAQEADEPGLVRRCLDDDGGAASGPRRAAANSDRTDGSDRRCVRCRSRCPGRPRPARRSRTAGDRRASVGEPPHSCCSQVRRAAGGPPSRHFAPGFDRVPDDGAAVLQGKQRGIAGRWGDGYPRSAHIRAPRPCRSRSDVRRRSASRRDRRRAAAAPQPIRPR